MTLLWSALVCVQALGADPSLAEATVDGGAPVPVVAEDGGAVAPVGPTSADLEGTLLSRGTRKPIAGAAITLDPGADGGEPTVTGPDGRFAMPVSPGAHVVQVQAQGFESHAFDESLAADQRLEVTYRLTPTNEPPYETVVHAPSERTEISRVSLSGAEIHDVAGTMGDPLRVVTLMPGVSTVASGIAYPVVRGSDPSDTGYYIDGIEIPILFHLLLGPEVLSPDFIESIDFYPSLPPEEEGRHITGAVSVTSTRPREQGVHLTAYADLINAGVFGEVAFPSTGTSVAAAARTSYTGWLLDLASRALGSSTPLVLQFYDYQARVDQVVGGGQLRLFVFGSGDNAGYGATAQAPAEIATIQFVRADLRYRHPFAGGEVEVGLTAGDDGVGATDTFWLAERSVKARAGWSRDLGSAFRLRLGLDADLRRAVLQVGGAGSNPIGFDTQDLATEGFDGVGAAYGSFSGAFAELTWRPTEAWSVTGGLRVDDYYRDPDVDDLAVEPRLMARLQAREDLVLRAGAGMVHQPPVLLVDIPAVDLGALGHGLQEGLQTEVGADWTLWTGVLLSATAYYNPLFRTVELGVPGGNAVTAAETTSPPILDPVSHGEAFGLELMLRRALGAHWFGWISTSLSWSLRDQTYELLGPNGVPLGTTASAELPFAFDETLVANAALTYQLPAGWTVGGVVHVNTGRPESGVLGSYTEVPGMQNGQPAWVPAQLNQVQRLPPYYRVDLQVSKAWTLDKVVLEAYLDVLNATVSWETFGFQYGTIPTGPPGAPTGVALSKVPISVPIVAPMLGLRVKY